ncbi:hypothetical protein N825_25440 [Skermanella stibiiresistens SB22]|uniref:DUF1833 domain-containing protein n=1 Tax=Skermanella stibiiresistens SB22 TaxID=1385369 RepID=W9GVW8_9PROT|nr:DUF1833 family protein [Skermanella stibiiresistens]EWY36781.1 hypothetical protein N825_25440 [Skermanella stibiiresistens SB22]
MPRQVSERVWDGLQASETGQAYILLVRISHPDLEDPIRLAANQADVISRGARYVAYPMDVALPADKERETARVTIRIDNVDQMIVTTLRQIATPVSVDIEIVELDTPDLLEAGPYSFELASASYDALQVSGSLGYEPKLRNAWPDLRYDPATAPGVF